MINIIRIIRITIITTISITKAILCSCCLQLIFASGWLLRRLIVLRTKWRWNLILSHLLWVHEWLVQSLLNDWASHLAMAGVWCRLYIFRNDEFTSFRNSRYCLSISSSDNFTSDESERSATKSSLQMKCQFNRWMMICLKYCSFVNRLCRPKTKIYVAAKCIQM